MSIRFNKSRPGDERPYDDGQPDGGNAWSVGAMGCLLDSRLAARITHGVLTLLVGAPFLLVFVGCGGGTPSQQEMIRQAKRRKKAMEARQLADGKNGGLPADSPHVIATSKATSIPPANVQQPSGKITNPADSNAQSTPHFENATTGAGSASATAGSDPPTPDAEKPRLSNKKPDAPLSVSERRLRSAENMRRIAVAMTAYTKARNVFPTPAMQHGGAGGLLSWRVELLPYLGYKDLYEQFHLKEPWNSPHNKKLLEQIPAEYQSPERFDVCTNYLAPLGTGTLFPGGRSVALRRVEDGVENTVMLVEANDELATPWTKPQDYRVNLADPSAGLGDLRGDGFIVAWGSGLVGLIPFEAPRAATQAMFTADGGENFSFSQVHLEVEALPAASLAGGDGGPTIHPEPKKTLEPATIASSGSPHFKVAPSAARKTKPLTGNGSFRVPVPTESEQQASRALLKDILEQDFDKAKTPSAKRALAKQLSGHAARVDEDASGRFVLLETARNMAANSGDTAMALSLCDDLSREFAVNEFELKTDTLVRLSQQLEWTADSMQVLRESNRMLDEAILRDDFETASRLHRVAVSAARRMQNRPMIIYISNRKREITASKRFHQQANAAIQSHGDNPNDASANAVIGKYICLVKGQWTKGLPMLARGNDSDFKYPAELEIESPQTAESQIELADAWWRLAKMESDFQHRIRSRAVFWYEQALPQLREGLVKVKVELRLKEARREKPGGALAG